MSRGIIMGLAAAALALLLYFALVGGRNAPLEVSLPDEPESYAQVVSTLRRGENVELRVPLIRDGKPILRDGAYILKSQTIISFGKLPDARRKRHLRQVRQTIKSLSSQLDAMGNPDGAIDRAKWHELSANIEMVRAQLDILTKKEEILSETALSFEGYYGMAVSNGTTFIDPKTGLSCDRYLYDENGAPRSTMKSDTIKVCYVIDPKKYPAIDHHRSHMVELKQIEATARVYAFNSLSNKERKMRYDRYRSAFVHLMKIKKPGVGRAVYDKASKDLDEATLPEGIRVNGRTLLATADTSWIGKHPYKKK